MRPASGIDRLHSGRGGAMAAIVSAALLLMGATGMYMWFTRRHERVVGMVLPAVNLLVAVSLLLLMRRAGP